jgi:hypothetical protein
MTSASRHRACQALTALLVALLPQGQAAATEQEWPTPPPQVNPSARVWATLQNRAGLVRAPFVTSDFPEVSGFADVLTASVTVELPALAKLRFVAPLALVRVDYPAGAQVAETALGNLELGGERAFVLGPRTRLALSAALLAPMAPSGPEGSLLANRGLALAAALDGGRSARRFTPGVTGLIAGGSVQHTEGPLELRAALELPLLVRLSDAALPTETETHALGLAPVLDLRAAYWVTTWLGATLGASLITELLRVQEPIRDRDRTRRLQPVVEPGVHFGVGRHLLLTVDASIPVGGSLGGETFSVGVGGRLRF